MQRREFIRAQQGQRMRRIGVLKPAADSDQQAHLAAFLQALRHSGCLTCMLPTL
jgi:hypothetical protein